MNSIFEKTKRILKNFSLLMIGKIFGDIFTFLFFVIMSRIYGQEGIGQYSFAMALTTIFAVLSDFGLYKLSVKDLSQKKIIYREYLSRLFCLRIILSFSAFGLLVLFVLLMSYRQDVALIIILIGIYQIAYSVVDGFGAVFIAEEEMHIASLLDFSLRFICAVIGTLVVLSGGGLVTAVAIMPIVTVLYILVGFKLLKKRFGKIFFLFSWDNTLTQLKEALPYFLHSLLFFGSSRMDIIVIGFLIGTDSSGIYNAAYRIVYVIMFLSSFVGLSLFPVASKLFNNSSIELKNLFNFSLKIAVLISLPLGGGLWLISGKLIEIIYGSDFKESSSVLSILSLTIVFSMVKKILEIFLISCDLQREVTKGYGHAFWGGAITICALTYFFGVLGAAISSVFIDFFLILYFIAKLFPIFGMPKIVSRVFISTFSVIAFLVPLKNFENLPLIVVIALAITIYSLSLILFKDIRNNEVKFIFNLVRK